MWVEFVVGSQLALRVFLWHENQLRLINASSSLNSVMYLSIVLFFRPLSRILRKSEKKRTMSLEKKLKLLKNWRRYVRVT